MFVNDDAFGVAAVRHTTEMPIRIVVRENSVRAELLEVCVTLVACKISINQTTDTNQISGLVLFDSFELQEISTNPKVIKIKNFCIAIRLLKNKPFKTQTPFDAYST